ncbi:MAG: hypothetical protein V1646_01650 [bacterium]
MNNKGFSLIECTIYLALFSFISILFLGVASRAQLKFMSVSSEQENLHRQTLAFDLLRRDLMSASQYSSDWDLQPSVLKQSVFKHSVFKKLTLSTKNLPQSVAVSWFIGNQGLMRAQGEYDFIKHEWIRKTSCLVCKSIKEINFVPEKCSDIQNKWPTPEYRGVWVIYKSIRLGQDQKTFVKFRNRVVA